MYCKRIHKDKHKNKRFKNLQACNIILSTKHSHQHQFTLYKLIKEKSQREKKKIVKLEKYDTSRFSI